MGRTQDALEHVDRTLALLPDAQLARGFSLMFGIAAQDWERTARDLAWAYEAAGTPPDAAARILAAVDGGSTFDDAYLAVTGESLPVAEEKFWGRHTLLYRWLPIFGSSATLWILVTALALLGAEPLQQQGSAAPSSGWAPRASSSSEVLVGLLQGRGPCGAPAAPSSDRALAIPFQRVGAPAGRLQQRGFCAPTPFNVSRV